jgi:hypothetical protein
MPCVDKYLGIRSLIFSRDSPVNINQNKMIQKTVLIGESIKKIIFFATFFSFLLTARWVFAQDLPVVDTGSIQEDTASGTPFDAIISAADSGGLSASKNLADLKPDASNQEPEILASPPENTSDSNPIGFGPDSLKYLESQGALSSAPQNSSENPNIFKLAVNFLDSAVFKSSAEFEKRPQFDKGLDISGTPTFDHDTAGFAIIKKGNQSVVIDFDQKYDSSPVITATLSLQQYKDSDLRAAAADLLLISDVKYIITNVSKKGFEIMMDRKADSDIPFSWHALAVNNPKIFKKKGESPKSGITSEFGLGNSASGNSPDSSGSASDSSAGPAAVSQSETSSPASVSSAAVSQSQNIDSSATSIQANN